MKFMIFMNGMDFMNVMDFIKFMKSMILWFSVRCRIPLLLLICRLHLYCFLFIWYPSPTDVRGAADRIFPDPRKSAALGFLCLKIPDSKTRPRDTVRFRKHQTCCWISMDSLGSWRSVEARSFHFRKWKSPTGTAKSSKSFRSRGGRQSTVFFT